MIHLGILLLDNLGHLVLNQLTGLPDDDLHGLLQALIDPLLHLFVQVAQVLAEPDSAQHLIVLSDIFQLAFLEQVLCKVYAISIYSLTIK